MYWVWLIACLTDGVERNKACCNCQPLHARCAMSASLTSSSLDAEWSGSKPSRSLAKPLFIGLVYIHVQYAGMLRPQQRPSAEFRDLASALLPHLRYKQLRSEHAACPRGWQHSSHLLSSASKQSLSVFNWCHVGSVVNVYSVQVQYHYACQVGLLAGLSVIVNHHLSMQIFHTEGINDPFNNTEYTYIVTTDFVKMKAHGFSFRYDYL